MLHNAGSSTFGITHGHTAAIIRDPDTGEWVYVNSNKDGVDGDSTRPVVVDRYPSLGTLGANGRYPEGSAKNASRQYESAIGVPMTPDQARAAIARATELARSNTRENYSIDPVRSRGQWNCSTLSTDVMNAGGAGFLYGDQVLIRTTVYIASPTAMMPQTIDVYAGNRPQAIFDINQSRGTAITWGTH